MSAPTPAPDRDLVTRLLAVLPVITGKVLGFIESDRAKTQRIAQLEAERDSTAAERDTARAELATDTEGDLASLADLERAVRALDEIATPAAAEAPDVTPVETLPEVAPALDGSTTPDDGATPTV